MTYCDRLANIEKRRTSDGYNKRRNRKMGKPWGAQLLMERLCRTSVSEYSIFAGIYEKYCCNVMEAE